MALRTIDIATKYGVSWLDGDKRVKDKFPTSAAAKSALPWAWQRWSNAGMTEQVFMDTYIGCAIAQDVAWTEEASNLLVSGFLNAYNFADWSKAVGKW